jgi:hypothetical protein
MLWLSLCCLCFGTCLHGIDLLFPFFCFDILPVDLVGTRILFCNSHWKMDFESSILPRLTGGTTKKKWDDLYKNIMLPIMEWRIALIYGSVPRFRLGP